MAISLSSTAVHASLLAHAEDVLGKVAAGHYESSYSHNNEISESSYHTHCYGFVNHLIDRVLPEANHALCQRMAEMAHLVPVSSDGIPCPFNLFAIFESLSEKPSEYWTYVPIAEIQPGDIIVCQPRNFQPPKSPNLKRKPGNHAMIVQSVIMAEAEFQHLRIIDCTREPHSQADTRYPTSSGVGASDLYLTYHPVKNYYKIKWDESGKAQKKELAAGRLKL